MWRGSGCADAGTAQDRAIVRLAHSDRNRAVESDPRNFTGFACKDALLPRVCRPDIDFDIVCVMGRALRQLLEELRANGVRKKDGIDALNIRRLHFWERAEARKCLVEAIAAGDNTAVDGLVALDGDAAQPALAALLADPRVSDESVRVRIAGALAAGGLTESPELQGVLDQALRSRSVVVRQQALQAMENARAMPRAWTSALKEYLACGHENDALNRRWAARLLLAATEHPQSDGDRLALLNALAGTDADARDEALRMLDEC